MSLLSTTFVKSLKRQALLKALDLLIDALIDFKQNYARKTAIQSDETNNELPQASFNAHL